jgi:hypothetical protein
MSELNTQLKRLNERVEELVNNPSELTKDALLAQTRAFYDVVKEMQYEAEVAPAPKVAKPKVAPAPVAVAEPTPAPTPEPVVEEPKAAPVAKKEKPVVEVIEEKVSEPVKAEVAAPVVEEIVQVAEEKIVEEKPKTKKEPLIGKEEPKKEDGDKKILAGQFNKAPLADLRSGIPLNEKFGIIRNLFKGNASDFGDAVLKLNNAVNAKEMTHYMDLLSQRFNWDDSSEAYQNFVGYVERKKLSLQPSNADSDQ